MTTETDRKLIAQAQTIPCTRWEEVCAMQQQAETDEARETLRTIAIRLAHLEEALNGNL